ncbi:MAG: OsmC family peroxiredoxin [Thermoleophilia bacterium]
MMATAIRHAEVGWEGALTTGRGELVLASGACGPLPISWPARVEDPEGRTSPEELLAAAQAACFAMAFTAILGREGQHPERLDVGATISLNPADSGGFRVTDSAITVTGHVGGIDQETFTALAEEARDGCPVSAAFHGNVAITVKATLIPR